MKKKVDFVAGVTENTRSSRAQLCMFTLLSTSTDELSFAGQSTRDAENDTNTELDSEDIAPGLNLTSSIGNVSQSGDRETIHKKSLNGSRRGRRSLCVSDRDTQPVVDVSAADKNIFEELAVDNEVCVQEEEEKELPADVTCPVCLDLLCCPYACQPCGHLFCSRCLRLLRAKSTTDQATHCPLCRKTISHCTPATGETCLYCTYCLVAAEFEE